MWYCRHKGEEYHAYLTTKENEKSYTPVFRICDFKEGVFREMAGVFLVYPQDCMVKHEILLELESAPAPLAKVKTP